MTKLSEHFFKTGLNQQSLSQRSSKAIASDISIISDAIERNEKLKSNVDINSKPKNSSRFDCLKVKKMYNWLKQSDASEAHHNFTNVIEGLKRVYKSKILPLEERYLFHKFHSPKLEDVDFETKPIILLVGQYSTGKTTFI
jgi:hypothetical protein